MCVLSPCSRYLSFSSLSHARIYEQFPFPVYCLLSACYLPHKTTDGGTPRESETTKGEIKCQRDIGERERERDVMTIKWVKRYINDNNSNHDNNNSSTVKHVFRTNIKTHTQLDFKVATGNALNDKNNSHNYVCQCIYVSLRLIMQRSLQPFNCFRGRSYKSHPPPPIPLMR